MVNTLTNGPNSQSLVSIQDFYGVQNKDRTGTIWGDMRAIIRQANLANSEVLGNVLNRKKFTTEDTFVYEYQFLPKIRYADNTRALGEDGLITMEKVTLHFNTPWLETGYTLDKGVMRSMKDWGSVLSNFEKNIYISKNDQDNMITMNKLINYALATGRYKILPNIDSKYKLRPDGTEDTSAPIVPQDRFKDVSGILELIQAVAQKKTDISWGQDPNRSQLVVSPFVNIRLMEITNYISASDASFAVFKSGNLGQFGGVPYNTSIYLDKIEAINTAGNGVETFDFSNVLGFTFDIDSVDTWTKPWFEVGIEGFQPVPSNKRLLSREVQWKTMCQIAPAREHLNWIFLRKAPDLARVNAARKALRDEQPYFYEQFIDIDAAQLDVMNKVADVYRLVGSSDTPNDGKPWAVRDGVTITRSLPPTSKSVSEKGEGK
ncbi:MAG: hypothetical protein ACRCUM_03945 [Mycoplasmoidaceae bacterium]